ncbi:hypothetical protein Tco_1534824 [Tanacetum coccineum]
MCELTGHLDSGCRFPPTIVHHTMNSSDNSPIQRDTDWSEQKSRLEPFTSYPGCVTLSMNLASTKVFDLSSIDNAFEKERAMLERKKDDKINTWTFCHV